MRHEHFTMEEHGFVGHLAEPDEGSDKAVIVIMGGEQSILPGIKFAERFADYGITGLAVSLFGADGLPESPDRISVDMFIPALNFLKKDKHIEHISIYGQSMGSIFACLAAEKIGGFENLILVSPTHVPFEGTLNDKKTMTGHSVATWQGKEIPYVSADFSKVRAVRYTKHPAASHRVTGMWVAYHRAYQDKDKVKKSMLRPEKSGARILMIAGHEDEAWNAEYSVRLLKKRLEKHGYKNDVKTVVFPHGSHLCGLMPNKDRERKLYLMIPLIGLMYRTFGKYRKKSLAYVERSEKEIIEWINA